MDASKRGRHSQPTRRVRKASQSVTDTLRRAVRDTGKALLHIAQETGIDTGNLSRFVRNQRGLSMENLDTLAQYLGLALVPRRRPAQDAGKRSRRPGQ